MSIYDYGITSGYESIKSINERYSSLMNIDIISEDKVPIYMGDIERYLDESNSFIERTRDKKANHKDMAIAHALIGVGLRLISIPLLLFAPISAIILRLIGLVNYIIAGIRAIGYLIDRHKLKKMRESILEAKMIVKDPKHKQELDKLAERLAYELI